MDTLDIIIGKLFLIIIVVCTLSLIVFITTLEFKKAWRIKLLLNEKKMWRKIKRRYKIHLKKKREKRRSNKKIQIEKKQSHKATKDDVK
jgi:hypothetical protein